MEVKIKTKDFLVDATIEMKDGVMLVSPVADVELETNKWKPEVGKLFYYPYWGGVKCGFEAVSARFQEQSDVDEDAEVQKGWVFKTKHECERFCKKLNEKIGEVEVWAR